MSPEYPVCQYSALSMATLILRRLTCSHRASLPQLKWPSVGSVHILYLLVSLWTWSIRYAYKYNAIVILTMPQIPGHLNSRRTPLGELNWIFTAVTDTIAWNVLPRDLFQKLFRQDLLVASLFRNFLLAERIMRGANCTPVSSPPLPPTCIFSSVWPCTIFLTKWRYASHVASLGFGCRYLLVPIPRYAR